jgi:hypothetical protein
MVMALPAVIRPIVTPGRTVSVWNERGISEIATIRLENPRSSRGIPKKPLVLHANEPKLTADDRAPHGIHIDSDTIIIIRVDSNNQALQGRTAGQA